MKLSIDFLMKNEKSQTLSSLNNSFLNKTKMGAP